MREKEEETKIERGRERDSVKVRGRKRERKSAIEKVKGKRRKT